MPDNPHSRLWRDRDFVKLWVAQATGLVGQQFSVLAMPLVAILTLHADATTVALVTATFSAPWVLFGLFIGVVVDRVRRRSLLIVSDLGRALLMATIPVCAAFGVLSIPQLVVLGLAIGTLDMCWQTAFRSYVPAVVPPAQLPQAYSLVGASDGVTRTAAPSLAGGLIQLLGPPAGVAVTSVTYVASAISNALVRKEEPRPERTEHEAPLRAFREGLVHSWRLRTVRAFALSEATYVFFWAATQSVLLVFLSEGLDLSPAAIGIVFTVGTVGGIAGAAAAGPVGRRLGSGRAATLGNALRAAGMVMLPLAAVPVLGPFAVPALMLARLVNSFGWTLWEVHRETIQQRLVHDAFRGRVNGSVLFLGGTALALGALAGAGIVTLVGVVPTLAICSVGTLLGTGWLLTARPGAPA